MLAYFQLAEPSQFQTSKIRRLFPEITSMELEYCFNMELEAPLDKGQMEKLLWFIKSEEGLSEVATKSHFADKPGTVIECGPRLSFATSWSSNFNSMMRNCGMRLKRAEQSKRWRFEFETNLTPAMVHSLERSLSDRMTECIYKESISAFDAFNPTSTAKPKEIQILELGKDALVSFGRDAGLSLDPSDVEMYTAMFCNVLKRNPTDVECFDLGQSNSEHSPHWFFDGKMVIDGLEKAKTLFQLVKSTLPERSNSLIAFKDNSSAIRGYPIALLSAKNPLQASPVGDSLQMLNPILTAETHNFPMVSPTLRCEVTNAPCSGIAPFPGGETGTGGRIRDVQATGRGAYTVAGVTGYCVGQLHLPGYFAAYLPWEREDFSYPANMATLLSVLIEASNGASDYGNKFGEPVICGFSRFFGHVLPSGERVEWVKPVMFTAGVGTISSLHLQKQEPAEGMLVCKIGGPAYRIGVGGGAASSRIQDDTKSSTVCCEAQEELEYNAVQRGDAEMENRMNRVVRGCVELLDRNPILSIHDQGAGGNGNVLKEIVDPLGARYDIRSIPLGDPTLSVLEIWGAEYQESNAILIDPQDLSVLQTLAARENCPFAVVGTVTGDGVVTVEDSAEGSTPYSLPLSLVLGKMPQKTFQFQRQSTKLVSLQFTKEMTVDHALQRILRTVDVGSKQFLTNKVDRSVTGLIAQQQCVGATQLPLADVATALSMFDRAGVAVAVGEQPLKGFISRAAQARMTVAEALSNLSFACISQLQDVKASCNWMWAAKIDDGGAQMYDACEALCGLLLQLGVSIDGGKDSLSMAGGQAVKSPGEVTLTCYAPCPDVVLTMTPDFKCAGGGHILFIDASGGKSRLGGSIFAIVFSQLGDSCPDVDDPLLFQRCFGAVQQLLRNQWIASGHDRSDGGLMVTLLEMAFAGNTGFSVDIGVMCSELEKTHAHLFSRQHLQIDVLECLFNEECGFVVEVSPDHLASVLNFLMSCDVPFYQLGEVRHEPLVTVMMHGVVIYERSMTQVRNWWQETSYELEKLQCNPRCVEEEKINVAESGGVVLAPYQVTFTLPSVPIRDSTYLRRYRVAVLRDEGTNGDREMIAAFHAAGFEAWDVNMHDLMHGSVSLDIFRGIVFCGGFSYADVASSAKGWAGVIRFNETLFEQFQAFRARRDTFSLGVCNGCQLMTLLRWVPFDDVQPAGLSADDYSEVVKNDRRLSLMRNRSQRFESRWCAVQIRKSPSVLLRGMEGSTLGIWVAHGEGRVRVPDAEVVMPVIDHLGLAPVRYVDPLGHATEKYPFNPNGSYHGVAALCSADGRHLAMMPHPERSFLQFQQPFRSNELNINVNSGVCDNEMGKYLSIGPWMKLFSNAKEFCESQI